MLKSLYCFLIFVLCAMPQASSMESYSLKDGNGVPLDHKIIKKLNRNNGIFIEVGAHDGLTQSNTYLLEKYYNWKGILIEPSPSLYNILCANRPNSICFQSALGSFAEDNTYVWGDFDSSLMSSVSGQRRKRGAQVCVLMRSLQSILDEAGISHIDFFSLDTEGYEYNILQGIDFDKVSFDFLLIEIYTIDYERICTFLDKKGYEMAECFTFYNRKNSPAWDGSHNDYLFRRKQNK